MDLFYIESNSIVKHSVLSRVRCTQRTLCYPNDALLNCNRILQPIYRPSSLYTPSLPLDLKFYRESFEIKLSPINHGHG